MSDIFANIKKIQNSFNSDITKVSNSNECEILKNLYLGRKGKIASLFQDLPFVKNEDKKVVGQKINN